MITDRAFEREVASAMAELAVVGDTDEAIDQILTITSRSRPMPRWLVLLKEPPMRISSEIAAGSPALRRVGALALALILVVAAAGAIVAGATILLPKAPELAPFGVAGNGAIVYSVGGDIYTAGASGAPPVAIVSGPEQDEGPWFSHDGRRFEFLRAEGQSYRLMIANADGSDVTPLLADADWSDWSPDDTRLAVWHRIDGKPSLSIVAADGSGTPRTLDLGGIEPAGWVVWRPVDGQELIFTGTPPGTSDLGLYAIRSDGSGLRPVGAALSTEDPRIPFQNLQVSPDGSTLAFGGWEPNTVGTYDGIGRFRDLTTGVDRIDNLAYQLHWSPDGASVLYETGLGTSTHMAVTPLTGDRTPTLIGPPYYYDDRAGYEFSPDGTKAILMMRRGMPTSIVDIATGETIEMAKPYPDGVVTWQRTAP